MKSKTINKTLAEIIKSNPYHYSNATVLLIGENSDTIKIPLSKLSRCNSLTKNISSKQFNLVILTDPTRTPPTKTLLVKLSRSLRSGGKVIYFSDKVDSITDHISHFLETGFERFTVAHVAGYKNKRINKLKSSLTIKDFETDFLFFIATKPKSINQKEC